jgi:hypothetical protein
MTEIRTKKAASRQGLVAACAGSIGEAPATGKWNPPLCNLIRQDFTEIDEI